MNPQNTYLRWVGFVVQLLVGAAMIAAGISKVFGELTPEMVAGLTKYGLLENVRLIGWGELISAVLMILPWTSPLGTLLTSGFWGGTICLHMSHSEPYGLHSGFLLATWLGAWLRGSVPLFRRSVNSVPAG